jgi:hypothetical protein
MRNASLGLLAALCSVGCAHVPLSASALDETKQVAFLARIEDEAGPKSRVFREDASYRPVLAPRRIDDKEADRRLGNVLAAGSFDKSKRLVAHTISRFELAEALRSTTLALLPKVSPWVEVVHPADVARVLESFLVQEVPANAPDYERLLALGADTVLELVVEEYGMRSRGGRAGAYVIGFARMFRINGPTLYLRRFVSDDVTAGVDHLDPFAVSKNATLFKDRVKQIVLAVAEQVAKDLTPPARRELAPGSGPVRRMKQPVVPVPEEDDPL